MASHYHGSVQASLVQRKVAPRSGNGEIARYHGMVPFRIGAKRICNVCRSNPSVKIKDF